MVNNSSYVKLQDHIAALGNIYDRKWETELLWGGDAVIYCTLAEHKAGRFERLFCRKHKPKRHWVATVTFGGDGLMEDRFFVYGDEYSAIISELFPKCDIILQDRNVRYEPD
jgi:hypothetical protein